MKARPYNYKKLSRTGLLSIFVIALLLVTIGITINSLLVKQSIKSRAATNSPNTLSEVNCGPLTVPPSPYHTSEGMVAVANLKGDPNLPVTAIAWGSMIDAVKISDNCYTSTFEIMLFYKDGRVEVVNNQIYPSKTIFTVHGSNYWSGYDIQWIPGARIYSTNATSTNIEFNFGDTLNGTLYGTGMNWIKKYNLNNLGISTGDETLGGRLKGALIIHGVAYPVTGQIAFDPWYGISTSPNASTGKAGPDNQAWIWETSWWKSGNNEMDIVMWPAQGPRGNLPMYGGAIVYNGKYEEIKPLSIKIDYNFPENKGKEVANKYRLVARTSRGVLDYTVVRDSGYFKGWSFGYPPNAPDHYYTRYHTTGKTTYRGLQWSGEGMVEFSSNGYNPLPK